MRTLRISILQHKWRSILKTEDGDLSGWIKDSSLFRFQLAIKLVYYTHSISHETLWRNDDFRRNFEVFARLIIGFGLS
jgi:hypothetical protein